MIPSSFTKGIPRLCIDASSMIYHIKTGLLGSLAAEITLVSTPAVIEEVGWPHLPVTPSEIEFDPEEGPFSNDESLLILARRDQLPILSEDKEILETAREEGMEHYNTLMMLNYLLLKGRVTPEEYPEYLDRLIECSRYNEPVLAHGRQVHDDIMNTLISR